VSGGAHPRAWRLSHNQNRITTCYGTVTPVHGGISGLNEHTNINGFLVLPSTLGQQ
jgi:hypothetical protein